MRRAALNIEENEVVSVPVSLPVQHAIDRATEVAGAALDEALAPFGLTPLDIVVPRCEQVIYEDEVPIYAQMLRDRRKGQA